MERNEKCFCGSEKKYKKCHLRINGDSKLANIYKVYNLYDIACKEKGICENCLENCSRCCSDFFFISESEFLLILEELLNKKVNIQNYIEKAKRVLEELTTRFPEEIKKIHTFMPTTLSDSILNLDFFDDSFNRSDLPKYIFLNNENKCSIYSIRPAICRDYGSAGSCKYIKNQEIQFEEKQKMFLECNNITNRNNDVPIVKRPYPIFYWFAHFLDNEHYEITIEKVKRISKMKSEEYYNFTKRINFGYTNL